MKHITFADKSLLVGDEAADLLLEYAAALAGKGAADVVKLQAISSDGDEVEATFLLDQGAPLMAETTHSALPEPANDDVSQYMRDRIEVIRYPRAIQPDEGEPAGYEDHDIN